MWELFPAFSRPVTACDDNFLYYHAINSITNGPAAIEYLTFLTGLCELCCNQRQKVKTPVVFNIARDFT